MYIIKNEFEEEIIIKNSRFITIIKKINSNDEIDKCLEYAKTKYPKATHYPYAYILENKKKSSDDSEPGGTAGIPILNILEHEEITNIMVVVVRYFGGIKLGTGGLARAYTKSLKNYLNNNRLIKLIPGKKILIKFPYKDQKNIDYILKDSKIIDKIFNEKVLYTVLIKNKLLDALNNYEFEVLDDIYIEKE